MPCTHMICSVLGCKKDHNSSLFRAPSPRKSWDLYCAWVKATGNPKFENFTTLMPEKVHICQKHFKDEEVCLLKNRRKTCVPTLQLPGNP
nr:unnamed protein product [Callosobruchus chinensis]